MRTLVILAIVVLSVSVGLPAFSQELRPGDIKFEREGGAVPPAIFPHWWHRIRYRCYACHPSIFEMKKGANKVTMDAMREGKFCATCHNGKIAWEIGFTTCNNCHKTE